MRCAPPTGHGRASKPQRLSSQGIGPSTPPLGLPEDLDPRGDKTPPRTPLPCRVLFLPRKTAVVHWDAFQDPASPRAPGRFREKARGYIRPHPFVVYLALYPGAWPSAGSAAPLPHGRAHLPPSGSGGGDALGALGRGEKLCAHLVAGENGGASAPEHRWGEEGRGRGGGPLT